MPGIREPSFAGSFYPEDPSTLNTMIDNLFADAFNKEIEGVRGLIVPHAGYQYSGKIAAVGYNYVSETSKAASPILMIGPNHSGFPFEAVTDNSNTWKFPNGSLHVKDDILVSHGKGTLKADHHAHAMEHSLEVQGPIIVRKVPNSGIIPVIIGDQSFDNIVRLYERLESIMDMVLIVATSDLSHYIPERIARTIDEKIISSIERLDISKLYSLVDNGATPCGYGPAALLMMYCAEKGLKMERVAYGTSADTTGDSGSVVGYTAIVCHE